MRLNRFYGPTSVILSLALVGCGVLPSGGEKKLPPLNNNVTAPSGDYSFLTATPTLPAIDSRLLLTPSVREQAVRATAQSLEAKGVEGFIAEGFTEQMLVSQQYVAFGFDATFSAGGKSEMRPLWSVLSSTIVNMDNTKYSDFVLIVTSGHGMDEKSLKTNTQKQLDADSSSSNIKVTDLKVNSLLINNNLIAMEDLRAAYTYKEGDGADIALLLIHKNQLNEQTWNFLHENSIPVGALSFEKLKKGETGFYGACVNAQYGDDLKAEMANGTLVAQTGELQLFGPYLVGEKCSGSGIFKFGRDGSEKLVAVSSGINLEERNYSTYDYAYPLWRLGEDYFWQTMENLTVK